MMAVSLKYSQDWIDLLEAWVSQQAQTSQTKYCMKDIDHITWSVGYSTVLSVL